MVFLTMPFSALYRSIYRMFLRVLPRAGYSRFGLYGVHPRRRLGGAGGPAAPVRGDAGGYSPRLLRSMLSQSVYFSNPLPGGEGYGVGPHKSLLDLLVRTDTGVGVSGGFRGRMSPTWPVCRECGRPLDRCWCGGR